MQSFREPETKIMILTIKNNKKAIQSFNKSCAFDILDLKLLQINNGKKSLFPNDDDDSSRMSKFHFNLSSNVRTFGFLLLHYYSHICIHYYYYYYYFILIIIFIIILNVIYLLTSIIFFYFSNLEGWMAERTNIIMTTSRLFSGILSSCFETSQTNAQQRLFSYWGLR